MKKLLSLVLSVSILVSSVTPILGNPSSLVRGARAVSKISRARVGGGPTRLSTRVTQRVLKKVAKNPTQWRILTGRTKGLAADILKRPAVQRTSLMRNEFVALSLEPKAITSAQRLEAASHYRAQLEQAHQVLLVPQTNLGAFFSPKQQAQIAQSVENVRAVLGDASALGIVGTREQAPVLLDFYKQAQDTLFADTATLIAARGLLRMQAYDELGAVLSENAHNPVLAGVAEYIKVHNLPVEVPSSLHELTAPSADAAMASFLETDFYPNHLHADPSLQATEQWMKLDQSQIAQLEDPTIPVAPVEASAQLTGNSAMSASGRSKTSAPLAASTKQEVAPVQQTHVEASSAARTNFSLQQTQTDAAKVRGTQPATRVSSGASRSGILYSGIPVMAVTEGLGRAAKWIRKKLGKKEAKKAPYEEPGLHDKTTQPIYEEGSVPDIMRDGEDVSAVNSKVEVMVGMEGFKLTVENAEGAEDILHNVNLTLSAKLKHFSPEYNRLALDSNGVFELRNLTLKAQRPDHFYFVLSNTKGEFVSLIKGADQVGLSRSLRVKIQRSASPKATVTLPVYRILEDGTMAQTRVVADVDLALLGIKKAEQAEGGRIIAHDNHLYFRKATGELEALENAFIRLPKEESKYWVKIFAMYPETSFSIGVFSTENKMPPLTFMVPCLQIGLGKTLGPVLKEHSSMGETEATYLMMGINNVLPALMVFVNPLLDRYGEARVYRLGVASLAASALGAIASGLCGHVHGVFSGPQLAAFLASSTLMALGVSVTRYLQGLLILANRGIVRDAGGSFVNAATGKKVEVTYNTKHLLKRAKEVFTKKSGKSLRDVLNLQKAAMYKNLGTMLFLSFPWLANLAGKAVGVELGLDFSASYVPYSLFSLYTLYKVYKTPFKNSFPLDITTLHNNFKDLQSKLLPQVAKIQINEITPEHPKVKEVAKAVKESIDTLVRVESRKTKKGPKGLALSYEGEFAEALEQYLLKEGYSSEEAGKVRGVFQKTFDDLGHRNVKLKDVMLKVGIPASLTAMTLATLGELGFSNNFAFAMRELVGSATAATGIVGLLLYGFMFTWRVFGNFLSQRISGGSMYALSSATAILGPMAMAMSHGNMPALVTGAIISCFGISNFFAQMYDFIIKLHPQYKREVALLINLTMPIAALGAPLLRLAGDVPGLDMALVSGAMAGSVALTPKMLADSSLLRVMKYGWNNTKTRVKNFFNRRGNGGEQPPLTGGDEPPLTEAPAN